jgi:hypothetical protein
VFQATVKRVKRGFWGPKLIVVFNETSRYPEPLLAEISKYDPDHYVIIFKDLVEALGDYDDRPANDVVEYSFDDTPADFEADGWDTATGRAFAAQDVDADLPF